MLAEGSGPRLGLEPRTNIAQVETDRSVTATSENPLAHTLARETQIDPDLGRLIDAWRKLPEAIRAGILAMVAAAQK